MCVYSTLSLLHSPFWSPLQLWKILEYIGYVLWYPSQIYKVDVRHDQETFSNGKISKPSSLALFCSRNLEGVSVISWNNFRILGSLQSRDQSVVLLEFLDSYLRPLAPTSFRAKPTFSVFSKLLRGCLCNSSVIVWPWVGGQLVQSIVLGFRQDRVRTLVLPFTMCVSFRKSLKYSKVLCLSSAQLESVSHHFRGKVDSTRWYWWRVSPGLRKEQVPNKRYLLRFHYY